MSDINMKGYPVGVAFRAFLILIGNLFFQHDFHNLTSSLGNRSTRAEDGYYTSLVQEVIC